MPGPHRRPSEWMEKLDDDTRRALIQIAAGTLADVLSESGALDVEGSLYHYTNAAGLAGILSSSAFWATDVLFLNDAAELSDLEAVAGTWAAHLVVDESTLRADIMSLGPAVRVACFSQSRDSLSQWRGYAGGGYALEFDGPEFILKYPGAGSMQKVIYGESEKHALLDRVEDRLDRIAPKVSEVSKGDVDAADLRPIVYATLAPVFKHPAFEEEAEVRFINRSSASDPDHKTRASGDLLLPYVELKIELGALKAIHVGPGEHMRLAETGVRRLLHKHELGEAVRVVQSDIPFRPYLRR